MTEIQDLQSHLQFQLSLLRLTMHQDEADKTEFNSEIQDEEHLLTAVNRIAEAMK
jgi:hypothetical protein